MTIYGSAVFLTKLLLTFKTLPSTTITYFYLTFDAICQAIRAMFPSFTILTSKQAITAYLRFAFFALMHYIRFCMRYSTLIASYNTIWTTLKIRITFSN